MRAPSPSWVDRLTDWARGLPVPAWAFYPLLGVGLAVLPLLALYMGGIRPPRAILIYFFLSAFSISYMLALIHHLDDWGAAALARFRPVLTVSAAGYERLRRELTALPARPAWVVTLLGAVYAVGAPLIYAGSQVYPAVSGLPFLAAGLDVAYRVLVSAVAAVLVYHTLHQLRAVSRIYTRHTRINLLQLGPLYALSNLAAGTAIGISVPTSLWFWLNASVAGHLAPADVFPMLLFSAMIVVTFIWPLMGAHRLLAREKQRLLGEVARRIERIMTVLHERVDQGGLDDASGSIKNTLDGLVAEQSLIAKLPTWPWRAETASGVAAALLLPILIYVIQRLLQRIGI